MSSGGAFLFLRRVALVVGVLLSSKSCFSCWGTAFFEEFTLFGGVLACLLSFFEELLCMLCYLLLASSKFCFTCGVAGLVRLLWLVGLLGLLRGGLLSLAFQFL